MSTEDSFSLNSFAATQHELDKLVRLSPVPMVIYRGPNHIYSFVNPAHQKLVGRDLTGKSFREAAVIAQVEETIAQLDQVYATGEAIERKECEYTVFTDQGSKRLIWVNIGLYPLQGESGEINGILGVAQDVTEQVEARRSIAASERRYRQATEQLNLIADSVPVHLMHLDRDEKFLFINKAAADLWHMSKEELIGKTYRDVVGDKRWREQADRIQAVLGGQTISYESSMSTSNGEMHFLNTFAPDCDAEGKVRGFVATATNITEQKKTESDLTFERHKFEVIFNESPAAMVLWAGRDLIFEEVNPQYQDIFRGRDLIGKSLLDAVPELEGQGFEDLLHRVFETGEPFVGHEVKAELDRGRGSALEERYYDFTCIRVNDPEGHAYGVFDHAIDVTDRVLAQRELENAKFEAETRKDEAERANRSKTAFLANMSHEIRTPMTAVLGFSEILRDRELSDKERNDALSRIERSGRALLKLIDDVLDISKIEAGKFATERARFSPLEVVTEVASLLRLQAEQKGIHLRSQFLPSVPEIAFSDAARVRQILTNLIGNAVKFTEKGEVLVRVGAEVEPNSQKQFLVFDVYDTGIGISVSDQQKLFQPFAQADESITRQFGGTGLGLMLSKRLAEQLEGDLILVSSKPHQGSCFRARIEAGPFAKRATADCHQAHLTEERHANAPARSIVHARILVVDDVPDNQYLMRRYLENAGAHVDLASDGEEAIVKALGRGYDVILMDIQMPKLDGIQATQRLRVEGYRGPILALTAHAMREEIARSLDAGCDEHLTKPVTKQSLIMAVSRYLKGPEVKVDFA